MFFWSGCKIGDPVLAEFYCFFEGAQQRVDPVRALAGENLRCILPRVIQPGDLVFSCHLTRRGRPLCVVIMSRRSRFPLLNAGDPRLRRFRDSLLGRVLREQIDAEQGLRVTPALPLRP